MDLFHLLPYFSIYTSPFLAHRPIKTDKTLSNFSRWTAPPTLPASATARTVERLSPPLQLRTLMATRRTQMALPISPRASDVLPRCFIRATWSRGEFRLIHFWDVRNPNTKILIGQEMLLIDEEGGMLFELYSAESFSLCTCLQWQLVSLLMITLLQLFRIIAAAEGNWNRQKYV